mmetsp:Transcript_37390/g.108096  ORF Transcript_37390/g.108096 Transcript_37390/m.108096 type:complete len:92 (+) Transcript_37390:152-427(+)
MPHGQDAHNTSHGSTRCHSIPPIGHVSTCTSVNLEAILRYRSDPKLSTQGHDELQGPKGSRIHISTRHVFEDIDRDDSFVLCVKIRVYNNR